MAALEEAVRKFLKVSTQALLDGAGEFSCKEAASIVELFEAVDDYETAVRFLDQHADGDDDPDDDHHDIYAKRWQERS